MKKILLLLFCLTASAYEFDASKKVTSPVLYQMKASINEPLAQCIEYSMARWTFYSDGVITFRQAEPDETPILTFEIGTDNDYRILESIPGALAFCSWIPDKNLRRIVFLQKKMDFLQLEGLDGRMPRYIDHEIGHALGFRHTDEHDEDQKNPEIDSIMNHVPWYEFTGTDISMIRAEYPPEAKSPPEVVIYSKLTRNGLRLTFKWKGKAIKERSAILFSMEDQSRSEAIVIRNNKAFILYGSVGSSFHVVLFDHRYTEVQAGEVGHFFRIDCDLTQTPKKSVSIKPW